ncbi:MAG: hypothetical protein JOY66_11195 [Acetobacteraceae bacterium]|nr:hypothetical protein [Acetobacteraceae bacterium]
MGLVLRLVETQTDSRARSVDVPEVARLRGLRDIAALVLTLAGAKRLLARAQQAVPVYTP